MNLFTTLLFSIFLLQFSFAQNTTMSAHTLAAMEVISNDLAHDRSTPSQALMDFYPMYKIKDRIYVATLCKINSTFDKQEAIRNGFDVGAVIGTVASIRIPLALFHADFYYPGIEYLEIAQKLEPELHEALKEIKADLVHRGEGLPQAYTGSNVFIGVVDWGFDYTHPCFYDTLLQTNRIRAAWDQVKVIGTPPDGFNHGAAYLTPEALATAQSDTFSVLTDYHGTHVAGIAGGSGGGTIYRGVGIESQLLFSQMRNDVSSSLDAFQWMYSIAQAEGKRLVINNSWGNYRAFPLDGTSLMSQAIDELTSMGVVFVFSAGNNGGINFHLSKTFDHDSVRTRIQGFEYNVDPDLWGQSIAMWGEQGASFAIQYRVLDADNIELARTPLYVTTTSAAYLDTFLLAGTDTVTLHITTDAIHPLNGRPQMTLDIRCTNRTRRHILYAEAESGTLHCWNTRLTHYGIGNWGKGFTAPLPGYTLGDKLFGVGHPGLTGSVITAAAHETNFGIANFSSSGPRMDGLQKPDLSAPGVNIVSSFNSFSGTNFTSVASTVFNEKEYEFVQLSGTSMSAPMITGAVALLLEADPNLSSEAIKNILLSTAREDAHTGTIAPSGDLRWGSGKLDVYEAILSLTGVAVKTIETNTFSVYPNPATETLMLDGELNGDETFRLYHHNGELITSDRVQQHQIRVGNLTPGMYVLQIMSRKGVDVHLVSIVK